MQWTVVMHQYQYQTREVKTPYKYILLVFTGAKYKCEIQIYEINANDHHGPLHSVIAQEKGVVDEYSPELRSTPASHPPGSTSGTPLMPELAVACGRTSHHTVVPRHTASRSDCTVLVTHKQVDGAAHKLEVFEARSNSREQHFVGS